MTSGFPSTSSSRVVAASSRVWLTFDDGPHPDHTATVLDVLRQNGIRATFFVQGLRVDGPGTALLRRMHDEGHRVGNHTYSHRNLATLGEHEVREEIARTESLIAEFATAGRLFRPPYGRSSPAVNRVLRELGYRRILWNVDSRDWDPANQPDRWVQRAIDQISRRRRSVVLAHDVYRTTAAHLVDLIERLGSARFGGHAKPRRARCIVSTG
jgi:peptidoglycan/xylan/chitin deacetylase (PgdA/CDA1 family)